MGEEDLDGEDLSAVAESLLEQGDPLLRRRRGVYATPKPLVQYVVRSVHRFIQERFERPLGLADPAVRLLDPCAGPMNFILGAWREAIAEGGRHGMAAEPLLRGHLLPHSLGIEIVPSSFHLGEVAVRRFLSKPGYGVFERLPLELGDSLAGPEGPATCLLAPGSQERDASGRWATHPIPVVLGNPPYSGHSANRGRWISELVRGYRLPGGRIDEGYYRVDGGPLGERNSKWLQDDAVKFLRYAQWRIDQCGQGIVAFVLNHNCLDAPTFRGLRASLLRTFEEILALDLHGNHRKRETRPDGGPDANVFREVAQGIAVLFLIKRPGLSRRSFHADLFGDRASKLSALSATGAVMPPWIAVRPRAPAFLFESTDTRLERRYHRGIPLTDIFAVRATGVITGRDALLTDVDRRTCEERLAHAWRSPSADTRRMAGSGAGPERLRSLREDPNWHRRIVPVLVRPFDRRHLIYADYLLARPRTAVMRHMLAGDNVGLIVARQCKETPGAFVTTWIVSHKAVGAYDVSSFFPLFSGYGMDLGSDGPRLSNVRPHFRHRLEDLFGRALSAEGVLAYVYAVLYSPPFRLRYRRFLQRDFPQIPLARSGDVFDRLSSLGRELVDLHLLRDERLLSPSIGIGVDGREGVLSGPAGCEYSEARGCVRLKNQGLSFEGMEPEVWRYRIGGYQVLKSWLQARQHRVLRHDEVTEFRWMSEALRLTLAAERQLAGAFATVEEGQALRQG